MSPAPPTAAVSAGARLPSVSLVNWRSEDPRARRRFLTALGDGLRAGGAVVIEAADEDPAASVVELLFALEVYFGLERGRLVADSGVASPEALDEVEVLTLWIPDLGGRVEVSGRPARTDAAVVTAGKALEVWTGRVLQAVPVGLEGQGRRFSRSTRAPVLLQEFRAP